MGTSRDGAAGWRAKPRAAFVLAVVFGVAAASLLVAVPVAAVAVTVPHSTTPVADADLDGNPGTGAWTDAVSATVPLENGEAGSYGSATLWAKHDGTTVYFRADGQVDVPWTSATGNHFWLGMMVSTGTGGHHSGGTWDGVYFGLWDGTAYAPQPTYPPIPVDTNGFTRPPARDATQNLLGAMRFTGTAAPYSFTAEWKRPLATGDGSDITFLADGATQYYFTLTTDSNGRGSNGGNIDHSAVTNSNTLRFATAPNTPPTVDLTTPDGGEDWSGGSIHNVRWNMSDAQTPTASLRVWINYSTDGGALYSPIAGAQGVSGFANPCTYAWTVPAVDTTQARVRVTVADATALTATDASLANFAIDSTPPGVTAFNPADGATGVSPATTVQAAFSEAMNQPSAQGAFSLLRLDTGAYASGAYAWAGNLLTFTPSAALAQGIQYRAQMNTTARDASDPGNPLPAVRTALFTTADVTAPSILGATAIPSPQEAGASVNVSAAVTDNGMVAGVFVEVRDPGGTLLGNFTAAWDAGSGRYFHDAPYAKPGTYTFRVAAVDAAGNWGVATGSFAIVDTRPPVITHTPVTQALRGAAFRISADIADADAVFDARVDYTDVLGARLNVSMTLNGTTYELTIPGQPQLGTLTYFIWARDPTGNAARTPTYPVLVVGSDVTPPVVASVVAIPPAQNATYPVNLTGTVTDNVGVQSVSALVRDPSGGILGNFTMARVPATDTFYVERGYAALGVYAVTVWASDTSDNNASTAGSFEIWDRMAPVIAAVAAVPPVQEAGGRVNVTAAIDDNVGVAVARILLLDPLGGTALDASLANLADAYWADGTYAILGAYAFTLTAADAAGNVANATGGFTVVDTQPPVAAAGPDRYVGVGALVVFDGSGSTDNSGIANYTWSFLDGGPVALYGVTASYGFGNLGSFYVTLTVTDLAGNQGSDTLWVNVSSDAPPTAVAGPGQAVTQGTLVTLDGSASWDDVGVVNYTWSFLDGTPVTLYGAVVQHRFLAVGNSTVTLTVRDTGGHSAADGTWVDVVPDTVAPMANAGPDRTILIGESVTLDGSASSDDTYVANYTWLVERTSERFYGVAFAYRPDTGGVWRFILTVADASGLTDSDDANVTVLVPDTTPPAAPVGIVAVTEGPGAIRVTWTPNAEPDVVGYLLSRADSAGGPFVRLNTVPLANTTYVDEGLVPGQRYWYVVEAVDGAGNVSPPSPKADAVAGVPSPGPIDWNSLRWVLVPVSVAACMLVLAFLAMRRGRKSEKPIAAEEPPASPPSPPPA